MSTDAEIARSAAALLRSGCPAPVVAEVLRIVEEVNAEICGLTPSGSQGTGQATS